MSKYNLRRFTMRDQSTGSVTREDKDLSLQDALGITDFLDEDANQLVDLEVGATMYLDNGDIYIERTA